MKTNRTKQITWIAIAIITVSLWYGVFNLFTSKHTYPSAQFFQGRIELRTYLHQLRDSSYHWGYSPLASMRNC